MLSATEVEVFPPPRLKRPMGRVIDASDAGLEALEKDIPQLQASLNNDKAGLEASISRSRRGSSTFWTKPSRSGSQM